MRHHLLLVSIFIVSTIANACTLCAGFGQASKRLLSPGTVAAFRTAIRRVTQPARSTLTRKFVTQPTPTQLQVSPSNLAPSLTRPRQSSSHSWRTPPKFGWGKALASLLGLTYAGVKLDETLRAQKATHILNDLHVALEHSNTTSFKQLLNEYLQTFAYDASALQELLEKAVALDNPDAITALLDTGKINHFRIASPLVQNTIADGKLKACKALLDNKGIQAAIHRNLEEFLILATVQAPNLDLETRVQLASILVQAGADPHKVTKRQPIMPPINSNHRVAVNPDLYSKFQYTMQFVPQKTHTSPSWKEWLYSWFW